MRSTDKKILFYVAGGVLLLAIWKRKAIINMTSSQQSLIDSLHPSVRERFKLFLFKAEQAGIPLRIVEALRSRQVQADRYAQGRTKPGKIITNAAPGTSWHEYGAAIDVIPVINGKATFTPPAGTWEKLAAIAKPFGIVWGGSFKSLVDLDHFEIRIVKDIKTAQNLLAANKTTNGYINVA